MFVNFSYCLIDGFAPMHSYKDVLGIEVNEEFLTIFVNSSDKPLYFYMANVVSLNIAK